MSWHFSLYLPYFVVDLPHSAVQDAKKTYLIEPPKGKKMDVAGSTITYGKKSGKEYMYIPGPINQPLRFMVRN